MIFDNFLQDPNYFFYRIESNKVFYLWLDRKQCLLSLLLILYGLRPLYNLFIKYLQGLDDKSYVKFLGFKILCLAEKTNQVREYLWPSELLVYLQIVKHKQVDENFSKLSYILVRIQNSCSLLSQES